MFERNPVDHRIAAIVIVEIALADGGSITGRSHIPSGRPIHQLLDGAETFLMVAPFDEEPVFVPKSSIRSLKVLPARRTPSLPQVSADASTFDPFHVLGVTTESGAAEIKRAYLDLISRYHPDRYTSVELPPEVRQYFEAKSALINTAYRALKSRSSRHA